MSRFRYFFCLGSSVLLLFGCQQAKQSAPVKSTPKGTIQIEQVTEAQIILGKLGQRAWVYKYRGGELTTELTIFHRPEGKDKELESIYHNFNPGPTWVFGKDSTEDTAGYIIVTSPKNALRGGEIVNYLSLDSAEGSGPPGADGANAVYRGKLEDRYPDGVDGAVGIAQAGDGSGLASLELKPGETKHLAGHDIHYVFGDRPVPREEKEMIRYVEFPPPPLVPLFGKTTKGVGRFLDLKTKKDQGGCPCPRL